MQRFFNPESVAVIGASDKKGKVGNIILENLIGAGFKGKIFPINPNHSKIGKLKCFSTVLDIEEKVDMAVIAIPAGLVLKAIEECAWRSEPIKNIVIISAGFSESGEDGVKLEQKLLALAKENGLKIVGPNCLGLANTYADLNASFAKKDIKKGSVGLIMQSGAFTTALLDLAWQENFGFSQVATLGNKMDLDEVDFLKYFAEDENTKVIGIYLESIKRGKDFMKVMAEVSKHKPILVLKAGASQKVQSAILSHTGAMAGEEAVARKAITQSGGLFFDNIFDFVAAIKLFGGFKFAKNNKVAIVTNAGGPGVITTDLIEKSDVLNLLDFSDSQKENLKSNLPDASSVKNPIDVLGDADEKRYETVFEKLQEIDEVGAVLAIVTPQAQTDVEAISKTIIKANEKSAFPILPVVIGGEAFETASKIMEQVGLDVFKFPVEATAALKSSWQYVENKNKATNKMAEEINASESEPEFLSKMESDRKVFYYSEAGELAQKYNINVLPAQEFGENSAQSEFPVALKVDSPEFLHKKANNALVLNIKNQDELQVAGADLQKRFPGEKIICQSQIEAGLEVILGIKEDPAFGKILMCALGGTLAEIIDEKVIWFLPANEENILRDLQGTKIEKVFEKQKIQLTDLVEEIKKISQLGRENDWAKEIDVNPIIFYPDKKPVAIDIKIVRK